MLLSYMNFWLGTRESHEAVVQMQKAKADGTLLKLASDNPKLMDMKSRYEDDDEYRMGSELISKAGNVAIISVKGGLVPSYAWYNSWFGVVSYEEIRDALEMAVEDDNVKKIVLDVDSPGGAVQGLDDLGEFIRLVDTRYKPVEAHTSSHAHSAGYWLIASARKIVANKMASTGSIGVIMTLVNMKGAYDDVGIEYHYFRSGKFKALGQRGEEITDEMKEEFMETVMTLHGFFEEQVLRGRPNAASHKAKWNEGKTFFAKEALTIGLIDEIASFDTHVAKLYESSNNKAAFNSDYSSLLTKEAIDMFKFTEEQKAKLASGVALEDLGLSAEDLEQAKALLAAESVEEEGNSEESASSDEEGSDTSASDGEPGDEENSEASSDEEGSDTSASDGQFSQLMEMNSGLTKDLAKAEVKLESAEEKIVALESQISALQSTEQTLTAIVAEATGKLLVSLGGSATGLDSLGATALIEAHTDAKEKFNAIFNVGATSKQVTEARAEQESLQQPQNPIKKVK